MFDVLNHYCRNIGLLSQRVITRLDRNHSRIGYIGAQGYENLGDEAVYLSALSLFADMHLVSISQPRIERFLCIPKLAGPAYFKAAILGGGTLINDIWLPQVQELVDQNVPVFSLGTGVGSCGTCQPSKVDIRHWKGLLEQFLGIGVRGPLSQARLAGMGIENAEVIGDTAMYLARTVDIPDSLSDKFIVNLAGPVPSGSDLIYTNAFKESLRAVTRLIKDGYVPVPIAMCKSDIEPLRELMSLTKCSSTPISLIKTPADFFEIAVDCCFTMAVRLHAAILSTCVDVPPLLLGYRDKCLDFMLSMGLEDWHVDLETVKAGEVESRALQLARASKTIRPDIAIKAMHYKNCIQDYVSDIICSL